MGDNLAVEIMDHIPHDLDSTSWRMLVLIAREAGDSTRRVSGNLFGDVAFRERSGCSSDSAMDRRIKRLTQSGCIYTTFPADEASLAPDYTMGAFRNGRILGELVRPEPTGLYRFYGEADDILYVGISWHPAERFKQHARTKAWWPEVKSYELKWYTDRPTAENVETGLIRKLRPPYNRTDMPTPYRPYHRPLSAA
jgi:hypothetical protein